MALSENPGVEELKELAKKYANVEVTRDDSLNAGNCESGTDEFIEDYFEGRESVKVSELVEYLDDFNGVQEVLKYKFTQLEDDAPSEQTETTSEQTQDEEPDEHPF